MNGRIQQWVLRSMETCDVCFTETEPLSLDLTTVYRGQGFSRRHPLGRCMRWALWQKREDAMEPIAIAALRCGGFAHSHEYGEIRFGEWTLRLSREGRDLIVVCDENVIGTIRYSIGLRLFYWGSASILSDNYEWGRVILPVVGPSMKQVSDCFGRVYLNASQSLHFLLKPRDRSLPKLSARLCADRAFRSHPAIDSTPLFLPAEEDILDRLGRKQKCMLLAVSLWARMFYTYA